ncbi:hypothetical protein [Sinorhizobium psoraleae]|uniref:Uncharacterized protein n=1 Tax=Sinorhizobium psoraleae TaxID=520838 RepID=A0ABT4K9P3_9HYPH|nr:hypothetical protein [Sinorhizobium psoraleae]MCZ4088616.1 hypothetical protein [Sinorhizobium psoraleae]
MIDDRVKRIHDGLRRLKVGVGDPHRQGIGGCFPGDSSFSA